MKAVFIEQNGDASVLRYADFTKPEPAPGQVLVKLAAAGVNFIDTYHRSGLYKIPLPAVLGMEVAGQAGAGDVILYREQDVVAEVKRLTDGKGVDVVYDGVGEATFMQSLDCLKPRGMMALFGQSSGPVKPVDPSLLQNKGSLFLTRPTLGNYASPDEVRWRSSDVLGWILNKKLEL